MSVLSDMQTYRYSGLSHFHYQTQMLDGSDKRNLRDRNFEEPFPKHSIVGPLYITFDNFERIPKPENYKAFFVTRDPRELVVSWYFSTKTNHLIDKKTAHSLYDMRQKLLKMSKRDGLIYAIDALIEQGYFATLASWWNAEKLNESVMIVRYEDLISSDQFAVFKKLYDFLDINIPDDVLRRLLEAYSFRRLTGRKSGEENVHSHLRSGGTSTWKNHFDSSVEAHFRSEVRAHHPALEERGFIC
jgi:hypothetical protein